MCAPRCRRSVASRAYPLGSAHAMSAGWLRHANIKSESCYRTRLLLTYRRNLKAKFLDLENANPPFAEAVWYPALPKSDAPLSSRRCAAVAEDHPLSSELRDAMLSRRGGVKKVLPAARSRRQNGGAQRGVPTIHGIPGAAPMTVLSFITAIDDPVTLPPLA